MFDPHALKILEFDEIKKLIARKAHWELGSRKLMALTPMENVDDITDFQHKVRQMEDFLNEGGSLSLSGLSDVSDLVQASVKGVTLAIHDFLAILKNVQITALVKKQLLGRAHFPFIAFCLERIETAPHLERALSQSFDQKGGVLDSASPELKEIRERARSWKRRSIAGSRHFSGSRAPRK